MLLLKQNSGVYWNEGAYSVGTLIREGALIGRRALNSNHCGNRLIGQSVNQSISPFVSDLNGTSVFEIGKVASAAPIGIFLRSILYNILFAKQENLTGSLFCW